MCKTERERQTLKHARVDSQGQLAETGMSEVLHRIWFLVVTDHACTAVYQTEKGYVLMFISIINVRRTERRLGLYEESHKLAKLCIPSCQRVPFVCLRARLAMHMLFVHVKRRTPQSK